MGRSGLHCAVVLHDRTTIDVCVVVIQTVRLCDRLLVLLMSSVVIFVPILK